MAAVDCECDCFSDERSMPIERGRKSGIVAFVEVSEITMWISDEVGFSKIGGELAFIYCTIGDEKIDVSDRIHVQQMEDQARS